MDNEKILEYFGINKFRKKGYTGKGITAIEMESPNSPHGQKVVESALFIAPDLDIKCMSSGYNTSGNSVIGNVLNTIDYIIENNIDLFGSSTSGTTNPQINQLFQKAIDNGAIGSTSAGNTGEYLTGYARADVLISTGAVDYNEKKNRFYKESYSSTGKELDYVMTAPYDRNGTSFTSPALAMGMFALIQQFFYEKTGKKLNQTQMIKFVDDHCMDLGEPGTDEVFGRGLLILPNPEDIDVYKYIGRDDMETKYNFILLNLNEFESWLKNQNIKRKINIIQHHHTWKPDYNSFKNNHFELMKSMKRFHVDERGFSDIAQNITIFPDGMIGICRSLEKQPAGIYGHNYGALCIESLGNFDKNGDTMTQEQVNAIVGVNAILCSEFSIEPNTDNIIYHHWFDTSTGKRSNGKWGNVKTCPGTNYFGGNKVEDAEKNLIPLIKKKVNNLDSLKINVLGKDVELNDFVNVNDKNYVSIREIFEKIGLQVDWSQEKGIEIKLK